MVYADCGTACPMIVRDMKLWVQASARMTSAYVLVSLDPARDTPEHLRMFRDARAGRRLDAPDGPPDDVQTLAALLGVRYRAGA